MNLWVKLWIGKGWIVKLVVAPSSEAVELDENVFPELSSVVESESRRSNDVFGGIAVGVKYGCADQFAQIWTESEIKKE